MNTNRRVEDKLGAKEREVPATPAERQLQLWHAVIGTNGSGLVTKVDTLASELSSFRIEYIRGHSDVVTKKDCASVHQKGIDSKTRIRTWVLFVIAVGSFLWGFKDYWLKMFQ